MATAPWDPARAGRPGGTRFLASDADRERAVDALKTAFVQGLLTKDELAALTGRALEARTYGQLAAVTGGLAPRQAEAGRPARPPRPPRPARPPIPARPASRRRLNKKVAAWGTCGIALPPLLGATFLSYYGGFLVMFVFTFLGAVLCSKPPAPRRPGPPS